MKPSRIVQILTLVAVIGLIGRPALAEDTKGKWQFGFGVSFYSTTDYIRSNADIILTERVVDESGLPNVRYVDERPDVNILNEPSIQDDFRLDFNVSYGLTRWFAMELATSYLKAPVGNIEFYNEDFSRSIQGSGSQISGLNLCGPNLNQTCYQYTSSIAFPTRSNTFLEVGELTEIPVQLSGLFRFRPESPFDPYVGLGVGYIFTDMKTADRFDQRAEEVGNLTVSSISRGDITDSTPPADPRGTLFKAGPLKATVQDAFEWHAVGGVDYYVNEHFSFFVDARYVWTSGAVEIRADDAPQVRITVPDFGTLVLMQEGSIGSPYLWEDQANRGLYNGGFHARCRNNSGYECQGSGLFETEDKNLNGTIDALRDANGNVIGTEDDGWIIVLPPGSRNVNEKFDDLTFLCPTCIGNGGQPHPTSAGALLHIDTEDSNFNNRMDRFLLYGLDGCTDPILAPTLPQCQERLPPESTTTQKFVYPQGCSGTIPSLPQITSASGGAAEGCPPQRGIDARTSGVDDTADIYIVQGGDIRLGGFSLGLGFKFTF